METQSQRAGFTLLELIFTIAILAVLLALAAPPMKAWVERIRIDSKGYEIQAALRLTRARAVGMRRDVKFCPLDSDSNCTRWSMLRAMVFVDVNNDNSFNVGDWPLKEVQLDGLRLWLRVSGGRPYVRYRSSGDSKEWGSLNLCNRLTDSPASRQYVISLAGRVRVAPDADGDGQAEDYNGDTVYCPDSQ